MAYEINVSKDGKHYFATSERSIGHCKVTLNKLLEDFRNLYTVDKGYKIDVSDVCVISKKIIV